MYVVEPHVGRMTVHFRKVMAFGEADVVNEVLSPNLALSLSAPASFAPDHAPLLGYQAPPKPRTDHLNPYGRNPRRGSQLQPIAQQPRTQRERPGGIGGAAREMPPSPGGRDSGRINLMTTCRLNWIGNVPDRAKGIES